MGPLVLQDGNNTVRRCRAQGARKLGRNGDEKGHLVLSEELSCAPLDVQHAQQLTKMHQGNTEEAVVAFFPRLRNIAVGWMISRAL